MERGKRGGSGRRRRGRMHAGDMIYPGPALPSLCLPSLEVGALLSSSLGTYAISWMDQEVSAF